MRRPTAILLVLMGGGVVLWGATKAPSRACADARAQHRSDAEAICGSCGGGGHGSSSSYYHSGTGGSATTASASSAVASGGFGAAGHAAASGS